MSNVIVMAGSLANAAAVAQQHEGALDPATALDDVVRFPRRPRYSEQDLEDKADAERLVFLRRGIMYLMHTHVELHEIFRSVLHEDGWFLGSMQRLRAYFDKERFADLLHNPDQVLALQTEAKAQVDHGVSDLTRAMIVHTSSGLSETSGFDMRRNKGLRRSHEGVLQATQDVVTRVANPDEQGQLTYAAKVAQHGLRTMYHMSSRLFDAERGVLSEFATAVKVSRYEGDPTYAPLRRQLLRLAEAWMYVANAETNQMKAALVADCADKEREARQQDMFDDALVEITVPQRDFVQADSHSRRDLRHSHNVLCQALLH